MDVMSGWWAWRGNRGSEEAPSPGGQAATAVRGRPDAAETGGVAVGELRAGQPREAGQDAGTGDAANGGPGRPQAASDDRLAQEPQVPRALQRAAAWSWRLLVIGLLIYVAFRVASALSLVVLPCIAALLLAALLQPLTARLRRAGMPSLAATWCTVLAAIVVLAGISILAADRVSADYPRLQAEVKHTTHEVQTSLAGAPFHLNSVRLQEYYNDLVHFLTQHKSLIAGTVVTGGKIVLELLTGLVLMIFITFFLLKDGERIWAWLIKGLRPEFRQRADNAGAAAWAALVNYVRGTTAVAAIHAVFIGLALWLLGVPLLVPLIILVFLAAFVPLIGILVAGALAILVTLGTRGWIAAVILLGVFLLENQIESHLLQPLVVGRIVRLHPLAIILVLAVGGIVAGIAGAIVAVPAAAAISYAWPYLRGAPPRASPPENGTTAGGR
jgi:predicted PurR-regulated permease PerM